MSAKKTLTLHLCRLLPTLFLPPLFAEAPSANESKPVSQRLPLPAPEVIARLPPDGGPEFNRLIFESSPYLRQHARNPVDWYPWGEEAFARARRENKPVFLSVGYASCHWCHVMEHESFEDAQVAALLNEHFINVKVDREERPDVDQIYMAATQALTGHGGWPNTVFLDLEKRPFFAGTYFPKQDRGGQPGFVTLLHTLREVWQAQPDLVRRTAEQVTEEIQRLALMTNNVPHAELDGAVIARASASFAAEFDAQHGGFGGAPKFPPHPALGFLLQIQAEQPEPARRPLIERTLDAMALGGIHDHVGGGFHRYAVDAEWFLPHFEKMLYDNAQLARAYARAHALTGRPEYRAVAEDTLDWTLRDLRHPEGGFYSAYDADSEGEEGRFYLWTRADAAQALGEGAEGFLDTYQITAAGNYLEEATGRRTRDNIPHLRAFPPDLQEFRPALARLREARAKRVWPLLDDKILTAWNGLQIGALATAGRVFQRPDYLREAERTAEFILTRLGGVKDLRRTWRAGEARIPAYLDDYAFLALGLLDLHAATGQPRWQETAAALCLEVERRFADPQRGGFYYTADHHETLLVRNKEPFDNATPAPNGIHAQVLARLAALTGDATWRDRAERQLQAFGPLAARVPTAMASYLEAWLLLPRAEAPPPAGTWAEARLKPVTARVVGLPPVAAPASEVRGEWVLEIDPEWHLNANPPARDYLIPLRVSLAAGQSGELVAPAYPAGKDLSLAGDPDGPITVYAGVVRFPFVFRLPAGATGEFPLRLEVAFQACDHQGCQPPRTLPLAGSLRVE
jgi:uncharacterized protein YyaL (SSP411 family)